jgi:hypothetical protein
VTDLALLMPTDAGRIPAEKIMTRFRIFAGMVLCLVATAAAGSAPSAGNIAVREVIFDGCHFQISDPYRARVSADTESTTHSASYIAEINPKARYPFETWIQFDCENDVGLNDLPKLASVGKENGQWVIAFNGDAKAVNTTLYTLHGKGWEGAGITQDQQDGDEDKRTRSFAFCLLRGSQALCGTSDTVMYLAHPKESVLPQVIKLLESIEFIDTPPLEPVSSGTATSPRGK